MSNEDGLKPVEVLGIASGKGGVGKTTVSCNLAVALAQAGKRVWLLDADLGLANAQLALGVRAEYNISHVLRGLKSVPEIALDVRTGLKLVPGASGVQEMASLSNQETAGIIHAFSEISDPIDVLVVDVAAGLSPSVLSFMGACTRRVVVVKDEPSSIADAYGMIKVLIRDRNLDEIHLLANMVHSEQHGLQLYQRLNEVCGRFLGASIKYLGCIEADDFVLQSQRKYQPVLEFAPGSAASRDFRRLARTVVELPPLEAPSPGLQFFTERLIGHAQGRVQP